MESPHPQHPVPVMPPSPSAPPRHRPNRGRQIREVISTIGLFLLAPLLALLLTAYVFQFYRVDGSSMERTLHNNDRLIIFKLPRTWARLTHHQYVPARGDIVVFDRDNALPTPDGNTEQLIKRIVGLPGERVVIADGDVRIYNDEHPEGFNPDKGKPYAQETTVSQGHLETTLKDNEVFVLGDNRSNSLDSRVFGPLAVEHIVGKLSLRVYPFNTY